MSDVTVRLQALDGAWETCGADRARGVWPENVELTADRWGPKTASFDLKRDPKSTWPDLGAFTPVEIDVDGVLRWSGRVAQTPVRDDLDSVISVQCEGWQAHLDDDLYERVYVHTQLADWRDARSFLQSPLGGGGGQFMAAGQVSADRGIQLLIPNGTTLPSTARAAGVILDLGPGRTAVRVVATYESSNNDMYMQFVLSAADAISDLLTGGTNENLAYFTMYPSAASGTVSGTCATPHRYFSAIMGDNAGGGHTISGDVWIRLTSIQVFAASAYESGGASILKPDVVVKDALTQATLLLDSDRTLIDAGTFSIPEFAMTAPRTPRQVWEAVDSFEDRMKKIDARRRPVYTAKPAAAEVEVGAFTAMTFEDSAANDGGEVYSRVTVVGEQPDSTALRVTREQSEQPTARRTVSAIQPANPGFETNTSGWTANTSTITRTTTAGQFASGSAGGRWDNTGADDALGIGDYLTLTGFAGGTFLKGRTYVCAVKLKSEELGQIRLEFGFAGPAAGTKTGLFAGGFTEVTVPWTPAADYDASSVSLTITSLAGTARYYIDDVTVYEVAPTIVNRRRFRRAKTLDIGFQLTQSAAQQIADKWLAAHQRTPSKGTLKLTGPARHILTGQPVQPEALLDKTDHLIRLSDRIDPDTGAVGRDVRIAEVSVRPETREATVQLDSTRGGFDALLSRLEVVLGQGR